MIEAVPPPFVPRPDWFAAAACKGTDVNLFFPDVGHDAAEAVAICAGCPVRVECREYAVSNGERNGVWGGETVRDRQRLKPTWRPNHGRASTYNVGCRCDPCSEAKARYKANWRPRLVEGGAA